ncbi:glutathione S-transferase [Mesorhizobium australicum]|uniref:Glutathione S-transferase n=2 Tax=Mesorhizobium australicum TaxID=536018 RepID=A0A1X7N7M4_9HYPH|nr:glutathione S-transferase [Mesorhizobium australicum]
MTTAAPPDGTDNHGRDFSMTTAHHIGVPRDGDPTLFYSPGACSLASHIALEESGHPYRAIETLLAKNQHQTPEFLEINPRGRVPALSVDGKVITENTAILTWIATAYPEAGLLPTDLISRMQCVAQMAWFSNTPHIFQRARFRPHRFVDHEDMHDAIRTKAASSYWECMREIDALIGDNHWMMGDAYTVVDPYALVFYGWGTSNGLPMQDLKNYTRHKVQMLQRPAVIAVIEREQNRHFLTK